LTKHRLLLETIKCEDGKIFNLSYHQRRCDTSRKLLFSCLKHLELSSFIHAPKKGLFRCRILYDKKIQSIEYIPYKSKKIASLKIISSNINYNLKYVNRDALTALKNLHHEVDDILIEENGYIKDTSIANIAFFTGKVWHTPKYPLLKGTMRQYYLDQGLLEEKEIQSTALNKYTQVALMNAMIGFKILNPIVIYKFKDNHAPYTFPNP